MIIVISYTKQCSMININFFKSILDNYKDFQEVYTDGSTTQERVGFSIIFPNKNILRELPNICSIFTAEALAILTAIEIIIHEAHLLEATKPIQPRVHCF